MWLKQIIDISSQNCFYLKIDIYQKLLVNEYILDPSLLAAVSLIL